MTPPSPIVFRPGDDGLDEQLRAAADANSRTISDEIRAAIVVYLDLLELAHLRTQPSASPSETAEVERKVRDDIGRVLLAGISTAARFAFEDAAGVQRQQGRIGHISIPFDELITWVVTGSPTHDHLSRMMRPVPEAHFGLEGPQPHGERDAVLRVLGSEATDWSPRAVSETIQRQWGDVMHYDTESVASVLHELADQRYIFAVAPGLYRLHRWV